jgi:hypothetical protein
MLSIELCVIKAEIFCCFQMSSVQAQNEKLSKQNASLQARLANLQVCLDADKKP